MQFQFAIEMNDIIVYFIALLYALLVLTVGDVARRKLQLGPNFTRKIIHLFAGFAIWSVPYYPHPWVAVFVALTFVIMLVLANSERFGRFFAAMARPEDLESGSVRGPLWYAVSITTLTALFTFTGYERLYFLPAAAIHMMMLGDGMSAPIGMRYGRNHTKVIFGSTRSLHGCLALFVFAFVGAMLGFWFFGVVNYGETAFAPGGVVLWVPMILLALVGSVTATLVELISPKGTDNITLPFASMLVMLFVGLQWGLFAL